MNGWAWGKIIGGGSTDFCSVGAPRQPASGLQWGRREH